MYNSIGYPCLTHTSVSHNRIKPGDDTTILKVRLNEMQNLKGGVWTFRWLGLVCGLTAAVTLTLQIFNIKHKSLLGFQREQKMEKLLNANMKYGRFIYSDSFRKSSVYMVSWSVFRSILQQTSRLMCFSVTCGVIINISLESLYLACPVKQKTTLLTSLQSISVVAA